MVTCIISLLYACSTTKVAKASFGKFVTNDIYVSGNNTLSVQYDTAMNRVEVFTKDYHSKKDSIDRMWVEEYKDPRVREIVASNVKLYSQLKQSF